MNFQRRRHHNWGCQLPEEYIRDASLAESSGPTAGVLFHILFLRSFYGSASLVGSIRTFVSECRTFCFFKGRLATPIITAALTWCETSWAGPARFHPHTGLQVQTTRLSQACRWDPIEGLNSLPPVLVQRVCFIVSILQPWHEQVTCGPYVLPLPQWQLGDSPHSLPAPCGREAFIHHGY